MSAQTRRELRKIASDAYIYHYPVIENLRSLFRYSIWQPSDTYGSLNQFQHETVLADADFTAFVTPNNDTVYSKAWLDLEDQPIVLSMPDYPLVDGKKRYFNFQIVDGYTFNIQIISPRVTKSYKAASYLIVGPSYTGSIPIEFEKRTIRSSSRFTYILARIGVYGEDDLPNVEALQKQYLLTPLQEFLGKTSKRVQLKAPRVGESALPLFPFIDDEELGKSSPEAQVFFTYANFMMQYIRIEDFETDLFATFSKIGVGPGVTFNGQNMSKKDYNAIQRGISLGSKKIDNAPIIEDIGNEENGWSGYVDPAIFGTPDRLKGEYLTRAFAARIGIYGNDPEEAYYPGSFVDLDGEPYNSFVSNYKITFAAAQLPPIQDGAFWSLSIYRLPEQLFIKNEIERYSVGDRTEGLQFDEDGALTVYIQKDKPGDTTQETNWLPSPHEKYYDQGNFYLILRVYWPTPEALAEPIYLPPGLTKNGTPLQVSK